VAGEVSSEQSYWQRPNFNRNRDPFQSPITIKKTIRIMTWPGDLKSEGAHQAAPGLRLK
jgi:hypothetical protein